MAEGGNSNETSRNNNNFSFQFSLRSYPPGFQVSGDTTRGIQQMQHDLQHVIRELGPLIEQRSSRLTIPTFLRNPRTSHDNPLTEEAQPQQVPSEPQSSNDHIINMDPIEPEPPDSPATVQNHAAEHAADVLRNNTELRSALAVLEKYLPLMLIVLGKCVYDHKTGLLLFMGLLVTFSHSNSVIKREVARQAKRRICCLLVLVLNLCTCIFFIYFVFDENKMYYSLALLPPGHKISSFGELLWVVVVTDFVLKLATIIVKSMVLLLPSFFLPFQKRGKWYLFMESSSQLYRGFGPIQPWLMYLLDSFEGAGKVVGMTLAAAYMISKGNDLFAKIHAWKVACWKVLQTVNYGKVPPKELLEQCGGQCPICQDGFRCPVMLPCNHVFCEECVCTWFDRERTCPMCRAQVADDPTWRDGSTSYFLQLY